MTRSRYPARWRCRSTSALPLSSTQRQADRSRQPGRRLARAIRREGARFRALGRDAAGQFPRAGRQAMARSEPRRAAPADSSRACALEPEFTDLRLPGSRTEFSRIGGNIRVQRDTNTISLEATDLELSRPGASWRPSSLSASLTRRDGRPRRRPSRRTTWDREPRGVCRAAARGALRQRIETLAPRGELTGVDLTVRDVGREPLAGHRRPICALRMSVSALSASGRDHRIRWQDRRPGRGWHRRACGAGCDYQLAAAMARARDPEAGRRPYRVAAFRRRRPHLAGRCLRGYWSRHCARQVADGAAPRRTPLMDVSATAEAST